jgi:hypothetical protein
MGRRCSPSALDALSKDHISLFVLWGAGFAPADAARPDRRTDAPHPTASKQVAMFTQACCVCSSLARTTPVRARPNNPMMKLLVVVGGVFAVGCLYLSFGTLSTTARRVEPPSLRSGNRQCREQSKEICRCEIARRELNIPWRGIACSGGLTVADNHLQPPSPRHAGAFPRHHLVHLILLIPLVPSCSDPEGRTIA